VRVLYFTRDYTPHDHRFLTSLASSEHEVYALRLERRGPALEERPLPDGIHALEWEGGRGPVSLSAYPRMALALRRLAARVRPEVIHAGSIHTAALVAALAGVQPLVSMSWGSDLLADADRSAWMRFLTRFVLRRSTLLLGDCETVKRKAVSLGFPPERVRLFPWGVDLEAFHPAPAGQSALRANLGWQEHFVLLSLRSWEPVYGVDVLAKGFALAARQEHSLRLLLVGGGSQAELIRGILAEGGVLDRVHFAGRVPNSDLPAYYQAADLYVSASHSDGSSVSLMEALACGRPALLSDIPSNQEWVVHGQQGGFFRDGDPQSLAEMLLLAVRERDRLPELGQAARRLAEQRADWRKNFACLLEAYEEAARWQRPAGRSGR